MRLLEAGSAGAFTDPNCESYESAPVQVGKRDSVQYSALYCMTTVHADSGRGRHFETHDKRRRRTSLDLIRPS